MKRQPAVIGLIQALGLTAYVLIFASAINLLEMSHWEPKLTPITGISLFLLTFVFSALVSASLILGYPARLFFAGKGRQAVLIIAWSAVWLVVCGAAVLALSLIINH